MFKIRSLSIPSGTKSVDAVELWEVRWTSRYTEWVGGTRPESEVFPRKEDAEAFAKALRDAYKLLRHTSGTGVTIEHKQVIDD